MKNIKILFWMLALVFIAASCQEELPELGTPMSSTELKYQITQNPDDPNMIILKSLTEGVTPLWQTPVGRSTKIQDTVKIAFAGEYNFVYGVLSQGGYVQADTFKLTLTTDNLNYVNDPLWNALTGGVGNSKTWILDNGEYGLATGPLSYADPAREQVWGNYQPNWEPSAAESGATDADLSAEMTFSLDGGPILTTVKPNEEGIEETGTFSLNVNNHTLSTTDATIIRLASFIPNADNWTTNLNVLELNENQLRVAVMRTNEEGSWWYIWNYVSKEYAENYVPESEPEPPYDGNANADLTTDVSTTKTWRVNVNYPYNWHGLDGVELNELATTADSPDGFTFNGWTPPYDAAVFESISMQLTKEGDNNGSYVIKVGATSYDGTYTIDEKNNIDFGQHIQFVTNMGGWLNISTTAENTLRLLKVETDKFGNVEGLWLGQRSTEKDEYVSLHFEAVASSGGETEPEGTEVAFDNTKLVVGDLEGKGNLRLELYNDFGTTKATPPLDPSSVVFDNQMEITFTLQGISFKEGAAGSYNASIGLADADWSAQYWGGGPGDVEVTGDGTYTVYCDPGSSFDTALVFVVDISGMATDIADLSSVTATVESIILY